MYHFYKGFGKKQNTLVNFSQVVSSVEELLRFVAASNAALDKRVGNEQIDKQSTLSSLQAVRQPAVTLVAVYQSYFLNCKP